MNEGLEDGDVNCWCESDDDEYDSNGRIPRSRRGSFAEYYYRLKDERGERKRTKRAVKDAQDIRRKLEVEWQAEEQEDWLKYIEETKSKKEEVELAFTTFKELGEHVAIKPIFTSRFYLYSSTYNNIINSEGLAISRKKKCFGLFSEEALRGRGNPSSQTKKLGTPLHGSLETGHDNDSTTPEPFPPPIHYSTEALQMKDPPYDYYITMFSNTHIKLSIPRDWVFDGHAPSSAPAMIDYVGLLRDLQKEAAESMMKTYDEIAKGCYKRSSDRARAYYWQKVFCQ